ncbi:MAG: hypothetical protein Q4B57_08000 [Eubacteriales bacterium]|nr:hypothetical protein [Eubacteriales bacterium]
MVRAGVDAVLLAPTAINRQAYTITGKGNEVTMTYKKGAFPARISVSEGIILNLARERRTINGQRSFDEEDDDKQIARGHLR